MKLLTLLFTGFVLLGTSSYGIESLTRGNTKETIDYEAQLLFPGSDYPFVKNPNECGASNWTHIVPEHPFWFKKHG